MEHDLESVLSYIRIGQPKFLAGLFDFLRIPSISAQPDHRKDVESAARFVANELQSIGMNEVSIIAGSGDDLPLVYAERLNAPGKPTLLLYGHFDVQPVDPLNEWVSPPFEPQIRGDQLFARGSGDDKGQVYIMLKALEAFMKTHGALPVNIKVLLESEEESDGSHIHRFVHEHREKLRASAIVVLDTGMYATGLPTITTGLRGLVKAEIVCRGARQDLHSGEFGGAAPNAVQALAEILAQMKTPGGRIRIPGIYNGVTKPSALEAAAWKQLPFDEHTFRQETVGAPKLVGDRRYSVHHRIWALPTFEVNGFSGGYTGEGFKTIIPATARAKISLRLVPNMDPDKVAESLLKFIQKVTPASVTTEVTILEKAPPMVVDTANIFVQTAAKALAETFGAQTVYTREGGSIPVAGTFQSVLEAPVLLTGFTLPDCNMHAPNENMHVSQIALGMEAMARFFHLLGQ